MAARRLPPAAGKTGPCPEQNSTGGGILESGALGLWGRQGLDAQDRAAQGHPVAKTSALNKAEAPPGLPAGHTGEDAQHRNTHL